MLHNILLCICFMVRRVPRPTRSRTLKSAEGPKTSYLACLGWVRPLGGPQIGSNRNALGRAGDDRSKPLGDRHHPPYQTDSRTESRSPAPGFRPAARPESRTATFCRKGTKIKNGDSSDALLTRTGENAKVIHTFFCGRNSMAEC